MPGSRLVVGAVVVAAVAVVVGGLSSCTRTNPIYCQAAADCDPGFSCDLIAHACEADNRDGGGGTGCTGSVTCPDEAPICNPDRECSACVGDESCAERNADQPLCRADGACVQCRADDDCIEATADFCDLAAGACRGCRSNAECASEVCNRDLGTCSDGVGVLYVDNATGADSDSCGAQSSACATIAGVQGALPKVGPGRRIIRIRAGAQAYPEALVLDGIAVVLMGGDAVLSPIVIDTPAVQVSGGANVTIEGLTISGASGSADADGVRCAGSDSIVRLTAVIIEDNAGQGVDVAAPCDLRIARSLIRANAGGGVSSTGTANDISHSMIVDNGGAGSTVGGVFLGAVGDAQAQRLELNTVAGNQRASGAGGIACAASMTVQSSILWGNSGAQASGSCSFSYSAVADGAIGDGNIQSDPLFAGDGDYHLTSASPCIDTAAPSAALGVDIDGEDRPAGGRADMGADETKAVDD